MEILFMLAMILITIFMVSPLIFYVFHLVSSKRKGTPMNKTKIKLIWYFVILSVLITFFIRGMESALTLLPILFLGCVLLEFVIKIYSKTRAVKYTVRNYKEDLQADDSDLPNGKPVVHTSSIDVKNNASDTSENW